jgi:ankyrin repeat protein
MEAAGIDKIAKEPTISTDQRDTLASTIQILETASSRGNVIIVQLLLEKIADGHENRASLYTALIAACRHDQIETVRMLLCEGADVNARDEGHGTALEIASSRGNALIMQLLLEKNADIHSGRGKFFSAISAPASCVNRDLCERILVITFVTETRSGKSFGLQDTDTSLENERRLGDITPNSSHL